jgi:hypothetical protein
VVEGCNDTTPKIINAKKKFLRQKKGGEEKRKKTNR